MIRCLLLLFLSIPINIKNEYIKAEKLGGIPEINALKFLISKITFDSDSLALIQYKLGNRYEILSSDGNSTYLDSSIYYYNKAFTYFDTCDSLHKAANAAKNLANCYRKQMNTKDAINILNKGYPHVGIDHMPLFINSLNELFILDNNNKLNISLLKFEKLLLTFTNNSEPFLISDTHINLSKLDTVNNKNNSIKYLTDALLNLQKTGNQKRKELDLMNELGIRYQYYGDYKNAEFYFKKLKDGSPESNSQFLGKYYNNMANLYLAMKKVNLANRFFLLSSNFLKKEKSSQNDLAINQILKAKILVTNGQLNNALNIVDSSLQMVPYSFENLGKNNFLLDILKRKIYRYEIQKMINYKYFNSKELLDMDAIIDALRKKQTDEASKAEIRATAIDFYKKATVDCINNKQEKKALYFKEKAKSILLIENYLQLTNEKEILDFKYAVEALLQLPHPDTIDFMKTFEKLKPVLSLLVKKYETNQSVNNEVFYDAIEKSIRQNPKDHAYLDFFETEDEMLVFKITDKVDIYRLRLNPDIKNTVTAYKDSILNKGNLSLAPIIYDAIIKPLGPLPHNITIIPDAYLSYLPFEALHTGKNQDNEDLTTYDFLIKSYNIDYNYSLGMASLMEGKIVNSKGTHVFLPNFESSSKEEEYADERQMLIPLKYAKEEAAAINGLFNTTFFENQSANKVSFIQSLTTANVIHFAGHAILNNENHHLSYLAFDSKEKDESRLYLKDIAGVSTNAELIVLSACQTAAGQYAVGEGFLSLGRAMVACGSKSIVTSLWNVYDSSGSGIIEGFYKNLKDGQNKSNALHNSKLDFINGVSSIKMAHPYYWSAFVFIGDNAPLDQSIIGWQSILIAIIGAFVLIFSLWSFRKKV